MLFWLTYSIQDAMEGMREVRKLKFQNFQKSVSTHHFKKGFIFAHHTT